MTKGYQQIVFNQDYGFIGLTPGSSPEAFSLINGSFVEDGTISSVTSGTKAAFAQQSSKAIIYDNPNIKVLSYANHSYSSITSIDLSVFGNPDELEVSGDGRFIFSRHSAFAVYTFIQSGDSYDFGPSINGQPQCVTATSNGEVVFVGFNNGTLQTYQWNPTMSTFDFSNSIQQGTRIFACEYYEEKNLLAASDDQNRVRVYNVSRDYALSQLADFS